MQKRRIELQFFLCEPVSLAFSWPPMFGSFQHLWLPALPLQTLLPFPGPRLGVLGPFVYKAFSTLGSHSCRPLCPGGGTLMSLVSFFKKTLEWDFLPILRIYFTDNPWPSDSLPIFFSVRVFHSFLIQNTIVAKVELPLLLVDWSACFWYSVLPPLAGGFCLSCSLVLFVRMCGGRGAHICRGGSRSQGPGLGPTWVGSWALAQGPVASCWACFLHFHLSVWTQTFTL